MHCDAHGISRRFSSLTYLLNVLPTPRSVPEISTGSAAPIAITCYRLRHSLAIGKFLSGHTREEIADILDHTDLGTIDTYLQLSPDLLELLNKGITSNPRLVQSAKAWQGRLCSKDDEVLDEALRTVGGLGRCKQAKCQFEPMITCYACRAFKPYREADHRGSLTEIEGRIVELALVPDLPGDRLLLKAREEAQALVLMQDQAV